MASGGAGSAAPGSTRLAAGNALESAFGPDPGRIRLRAALRAVFSGAGALLILILTLGGAAKAAIALGFMCGVLASKVVQDDTRAGQAITFILLLPVAAGAAGLAGLLSPAPIIVDVAFICVVGVAILARLAGPRGMALGLMLFIGYFIGLVTHPDWTSMPQVAIGAAAGLACAAVVRFLLLPERPGVAVARIVDDLDTRVASILRSVRGLLCNEAQADESSVELEHEIERLNDYVMTANDQIDRIRRSLGAQGPALTTALLRLELSAERVARVQPAGDLLPKIDRLLAELERNHGEPPADGIELTEPLAGLQDARRSLREAARHAPQAEQGARPDIEEKTKKRAPALSFDNPVVRQAVQAVAAAALAIGAGSLVSTQRSYWAVIAAFIVQNGVGSRGETLIKALQRLAGTAFGVVAGLLLATAVEGHTFVALVLVLACVFLAYYAFQEAYSIMIFAITLMLALLYGVIGKLSDRVLVLRLEETAIGAAAAIFAAMFILPTRQREAFRESARKFAVALRGALESAADNPETRRARVLEMRSQAQALRQALAPIKRGWPVLLRSDYRDAVRTALRCDYLARELLETGHIDETARHHLIEKTDALSADLDARAPPLSHGSATGTGPAARLGRELDRLRRDLRAAS